MTRATDLKLIDLISLKPGTLLRLHSVKGEAECVPTDEFQRVEGWKSSVSNSVFPNSSAQTRDNFSKLLDVPIEFQILVRHGENNVVELLRMEPGWWKTILERAGMQADVMVDGRVIASGIIVDNDEQQGILITELASSELSV